MANKLFRLKLSFVLAAVAVVGVGTHMWFAPQWRSRWFAARGDRDRAWSEALAGVPAPGASEQLGRVLADVLADPGTPEPRRLEALVTIAALGPSATACVRVLCAIVADPPKAPEAREEVHLATLALGEIGHASPAVIACLVELLDRDPLGPALAEPFSTWALLGRYHDVRGAPLPSLREQARTSVAAWLPSFGQRQTVPMEGGSPGLHPGRPPVSRVAAHALARLGGPALASVLTKLEICNESLACAPALALGLAAGELPASVREGLCRLLRREPASSRRLSAAAFALALRDEPAADVEAIVCDRLGELCASSRAEDDHTVLTVLALLAGLRPQEPATLARTLELLETSENWRAPLALVVASHTHAGDDAVEALERAMQVERARPAAEASHELELAMALLVLRPGHDAATHVARWSLDASRQLPPLALALTRMAVAGNEQLFLEATELLLERVSTDLWTPGFAQRMEILCLLGPRAASCVDALARPLLLGDSGGDARPTYLALAAVGEPGVRVLLSAAGGGSPYWLGEMGTLARAAVPTLSKELRAAGQPFERDAPAAAVARIAGDDPAIAARLEELAPTLSPSGRLELARAMLEARPTDGGCCRRLLELQAGEGVPAPFEDALALIQARRAREHR